MGKIIFYTTNCPKCNVLKTKLDDLKIEYVLNDNIKEMLSLGIQTAPVLKVNDQLLDFGQAIQWIKEYGNEN